MQTLKNLLCDETKLYLLFLDHLPTINAFNVASQATSYTIIHLLHPEMKLTKHILQSFVNMAVIDISDITDSI